MSFGSSTRGELRMALAEYLRQDVSIDLEERKSIREVVGFTETTEVRYPNCSCRWEVITVEVYYETWDGELANQTIERSMADLITELSDLADSYGSNTQYSYYD